MIINVIVYVLLFLILTINIVIVYKFVTSAKKLGVAVSEWAKVTTPICTTDLSPQICQKIVNINVPYPNPNRPISKTFEKNPALYSMFIQNRLITYIGTSNEELLIIPNNKVPTLVYTSIDPQPIAAVWLSNDGSSASVSIRGTITASDLQDDAKYNEISVNGYKVHGGFYNFYQTFKNELLRQIPPYVPNVFVSGHSLGSALAFLFSLDLAKSNTSRKVEVIGFAPPRTGDQNFVDALTGIVRTTSIINVADMVPTLPWTTMPNINNPTDIDKFAHVTPIAMFNNPKPDIRSCHMLPAYFEGVNGGIVTLVQTK